MNVRDKEQWIANQALHQRGMRGAILAGTGFGKTRVMVRAIVDDLKMDSKRSLILVPFEHLKDRFKDEFIKVLGDDLGSAFVKENTELQCYASIDKLDPNDYDMVVCDEIHMGLTDRCMEFFKAYGKEKPLVVATATMPEDPEYRKRLINLVPLAYKITIDECVIKGIVAPYGIECVALSLTSEEQRLYNTINKNFGYWKSCLGNSDAFNQASAILKGKGKGYSKDDYKAADGFFRAIRQRKGMVDHAENKIVAAKAFAEIVSKYNGRMLVFGGDNSFTDSISNAIEGSVVYHSKKTTKQKDLALDRFKNGESNVLCSTKALNQGLDIPDASIGLICGLTSKALTMIQRVGRLVRIDPNDPLKQGRVVILYVKDSQEEKWLENALSKTDKKNVKWLELKDILKAKSKESLPPLIQKI
jgi:superfamily II DNA or RNA helicase